MLNVATPLLSRLPVPIGVPPTVKVTDPVGTAPPDATVAVNVTGEPKGEGFVLEVKVVVVEAAMISWVIEGEVLPEKFVEPAY